MTTEKVQSKIKSSTIAITVLSILLALAVASTIVLAAFSATRTASTTITFGGGLTMTLNMEESTDFNGVTDDSQQTVTITAKDNAFAKDNVTMSALQAKTSEAAYAGWRITVSGGKGGTWAYDSASKTFTNATAKIKVVVTLPEDSSVTAKEGTDGIFYFAAPLEGTYKNIFNTLVVSSTTGQVNDLAGQSVSISIQFKAETVAGGGDISNVQTI